MKVRYERSKELAVREHPNDQAKILDTMKPGDEALVLETVGEWTEVQYQDASGFVMSSLVVEVADPETPETPETPESIPSTLEDLMELKMPELRKIAKEKGLTVPAGAAKPEIATLILNGEDA